LVELAARSFAKINLFLDVLGKRDDGYHEVRTLIQIIDLCDYIYFARIDDDEIVFSSDSTLIDPHNNTVVRALGMLKKELNVKKGVRVFLKKRIPVEAGLGGGSSNAASSLVIMNYLWGLNLSFDELRELGCRIGADVPAFISGSLSLATGRGDKIEELKPIEKKDVLVVFPNLFISTKKAYESLDSMLTRKKNLDKITSSFVLLNDDFEGLYNVFEEIIFKEFPELGKIKDFLVTSGAEFSQMSGTGSAIFGIFDEGRSCSYATRRIIEDFGFEAYQCKFMSYASSQLFDVLLCAGGNVA